jgi:uncharacterized protein (TIGR00255 family)
MKSMTGFGQAQLSGEGLNLQVEISTVNRKNLDVHLSLPRGCSAMEARCHKLIGEKCARGRIQVRVGVERLQNSGTLALNRERARAWMEEINAFAAEAGLEPLRSVNDVMRLPQVLAEAGMAEDESNLWPLLEKGLETALGELVEMRQTEGAHLQEVLRGLLGELEAIVAEVKPLLPEAREGLRVKIQNSVRDLGTLSPEMQNRVLQEIAMQAERSDVQEEVDRLDGHLKQMREKTESAECVGRALDFICQEMARELNTLSVKASRVDINRLALAGKETVEKIREQVQNVE